MFFDPLSDLFLQIENTGGFVNSHAHLDRAYTVQKWDMEQQVNNHLFEKWKAVDMFKANACMDIYEHNITTALKMQKKMGTNAVLSFIDIDEIAGYRAIEAAQKAKQWAKENEMEFRIACQTLKGILKPSSLRMVERAIGEGWLDVLGSLPRCENVGLHLDRMMELARASGLRLHVHVDQLNSPLEKETEMLAKKVMQYGLEGRVTAVHSISLAAHKKAYRQEVYRMAKDAGLSFISCPTAWIDARRNEMMMVSHNAITPAEEMIAHGLVVAIGSDNIHDIYKPFSNGCMKTELRFFLEALHFYDIKELVKVATINGRIVMGLEDR